MSRQSTYEGSRGVRASNRSATASCERASPHDAVPLHCTGQSTASNLALRSCVPTTPVIWLETVTVRFNGGRYVVGYMWAHDVRMIWSVGAVRQL